MPLVQESAVSGRHTGQAQPKFTIRSAAVLGAGTMGARIAAHLANAGLPVLLLDRVPPQGDRSSLAAGALKALGSAKPPALGAPSVAARIQVGNFEDDLPRLAQCDWIIEAVAENLEIKRALLDQLAQHVHPEAILTTNTSGLPVAQVGANLPADLRQRWFGTHFFNPPRHMRLLEVIATPETDPAAIAAVSEFADRRLGKTVVPANDVPNFIANRIGTFLMLNAFKIMQEQNLTVEEIDFLTGPIIGWPKTGTFRLADLVGIDVLSSTARNYLAGTNDERSDLTMPAALEQLVERQWLGDKTGQGFYKKSRDAAGKEIRTVLRMETFEYEAPAVVSFPAVDELKSKTSVAERLRSILALDPATDRAAKFFRQALSELWAYSANRIGEVAESIVDIDSAITSGFNWELGPFELWDAAGVPAIVERMKASGILIPAAVEKLLAAGGTSWYRADGKEYFDLKSGKYLPVPSNAAFNDVASFKRSARGSAGVFAGNKSISLVDIGEGIGCFEFHSKMNALDANIVPFIAGQLQPGSAALRNFRGFIIANDAQNFTVGADLGTLMMGIHAQAWSMIEQAIQGFHAMTQAIKFSPAPVVCAPSGMCLGGGTEIAMHSALRQPFFELYAGLVETGVGLIPGGGGCKEMLLRALDAAESVRPDLRGESVEVVETIKHAFETIVMAKVSTSALEARSLRLIDEGDAITMNRSRLVTDARTQAVRLAEAGYSAPVPRTSILAPGDTVEATLKLGVYMMREGGYISEHDVKVANHVAHILSGGGVTPGTLLSEQDILDLEREAFLSLCSEPKTQERILFTLKTGKPLRN
jgi:3-hydroxyacyl-CoA dehydrogenase